MISLNFCPAILYKRRAGKGGKTWHNALSDAQPEFYDLIKPTLPLAYTSSKMEGSSVLGMLSSVRLYSLPFGGGITFSGLRLHNCFKSECDEYIRIFKYF